MRLLMVMAAAWGLAGCGGAAGPAATGAGTPEYGYRIVNTYPHDTAAFTEGLEFRNGYLYESTGLNGKSKVRKTLLDSGAVVQEISLPEKYFGEGITISKDRMVQLTYQTGVGFVYDLGGFRTLSTFTYPGEGWALTHDGDRIYMSDGTPQIRIWDAETLVEKGRITVRDGEREVTYVNELEWVEGEIWANVWQTDRIVRIRPSDGKVVGWIDLAGLLSSEERMRADVLNGIAYDAEKKRVFVTGKNWPKLFEIKIVSKN